MQHDKFSRLKVLPVCNFSYSPLPDYYTKISANCNFIGNSIKDPTPPHLFTLHFSLLLISLRAGYSSDTRPTLMRKNLTLYQDRLQL